MPTYQYECQGCKQRFEEILKIAEMDNPESEDCPDCGKKEIKRKIFDAPMLTSDVDGLRRVPSDFNDHLKGIKKFYRNSTVNTW